MAEAHQSAILHDLLDAVPLLENRLLKREIDLGNSLEATSLALSLDTLDRILGKVENKDTNAEILVLKERIAAMREAMNLVEGTGVKATNFKHLDALLICEEPAVESKDRDDSKYQTASDVVSADFDKMVAEWAEQTEPRLAFKKMPSAMATSSKDLIRGELAQLADTMKSKALWYRDQLVYDNKALDKCTSEHERQLDKATMVANEARKLTKASTVTLRQSLFMVATMVALYIAMIFLFILT